MSKSKKALSVFFWFTFGAFLSPSIPHIAYFFHSWEPHASEWVGIFWWVVCYAIAVSIDGTIIWLSHTMAVARREKTASTSYLFGGWIFIIFLTAVSWLLNWFYAKHNIGYASIDLSGPISESVFNIPLATISPLIASMFPLLAIMFTLMADKVIAEKPQTAEDLAQEADRLEALETQQKRISDYQERHKKPSLFRRLATTYKDAKEAFDDVSKPSENALREPDRIAELEDHSGLQMQSLSQGMNDPEMTNNSPIETEINVPLPSIPNEYETIIARYPYVQSWLSTGQKTATIEEIVETTGHSKRRISNRLNDNALKRSSRNPNLIIISSVLEWLKTASIPNQNETQTGEIPAVKPASNGHHSLDDETLIVEAKGQGQ